MKKRKICFDSLNIDSTLYFFANDEEIKAAEKKEEERSADLKNIIFSKSFVAMEYKHENGAREILHRSTRDGVLFQLSYIAPDGVPTMHENFIQTKPGADETHGKIESESALYNHFVCYNLQHDIVLTVLQAQN